MNCLAIETSPRVGSVALSVGCGEVVERELTAARGQARDLAGAIESVTAEVRFALADLDCISVGLGPGGYTGMRLAVATARSLGFALKKPVIGIPSTAALAAGDDVPDGEIAVVFDARKGFVYFARYERVNNGLPVELSAPLCLPVERAALEVGPRPFVLGDGMGLLAEQLGRELDGSDVAFARARHVLALGVARFSGGDRADPRTLESASAEPALVEPALVEPLYLRPSEAEILWRRRQVESAGKPTD